MTTVQHDDVITGQRDYSTTDHVTTVQQIM